MSIVQSATPVRASAVTNSISLTGVLSTSQLVLIVMAEQSSAFSVSSVADSVNTVTTGYALSTVAVAAETMGVGVYFVQGLTAGSHTLTVTFSETVLSTLFLSEVSLTGNLSFDTAPAIALNSTGTSATITTNSVLPSANNEFLIAVGAYNGSTEAFSSWTNGFTQVTAYDSAVPSAAWAYLSQGTAASIDAGVTVASTVKWIGFIGAFSVASGAPTITSGSAIRMSGTAVRIGMAPLMMMPLGWIIERRRRLARKPGAEFARDEKTGLMLPRDPK